MVVGIATLSTGATDILVHDNFVHLQAARPDTRWPEYGSQSGAYCCRIDWYGDNIQYYDNVMVTYGRDGGMVRGVWYVARPDIVDCVYRNNIFKAVLQNLDSDIQGCIMHGGRGDPAVPPVVFRENRIISNFCNVRLGEDWDECGCNAKFYDNTFVKEGPERADYRTIGIGNDEGWRSTGHAFFDSVFEGGASYDEVRFDGSGTRSLFVGWTLTVQTGPLADVIIRDIFNLVVYSDQADGSGLAEAKLYQYFEEPSRRTYRTPHNVTVEKYGNEKTESVTLDGKKSVQIMIFTGPSYDLTVNSGTGSGSYPAEAIIDIHADPPPSGKVFNDRVGDTGGIPDICAPSTTVTMPGQPVEVTATYTDICYTLTVTNGIGDGEYPEGEIVPISPDPVSAKVFAMWIGDIAYVADRLAAEATVTMSAAAISVTATYRFVYPLTVNSGSGGGSYAASVVIDIDADPAPLGQTFDEWIGDTEYVADVDSASTTVTMPSASVEVTATYRLRGDLNDDGFVGQMDLGIVLTQWGSSGGEITDPRADVSDDDFVGQTDLDYILDGWAQSGP